MAPARPSTTTGTIEATAGTLTIHDAVNNAGTLKANGGTLVVDGDVSGAGTATIDAGGTLDLGGTDTQAVTFDGLGTLLSLRLLRILPVRSVVL